YIPVYYFLVVLYGNKEYPGPYKEIEKGLILLYHIVSGKPADCIGFDGGYDLFIDKFINQADDYNSNNKFDKRNFVYPIRKEQNIKRKITEIDYNKKFRSFRSGIENQFSVLASKFDRFNNNRAAIQISDIKYYNLQFRVACILKNIWKIVEDYNIEAKPYHMLWYNDSFEFPTKITKLNYIFKNEQEINKEYNEMIDIQ
ncbi:hypothetical protein BDA99DRAFT_419202, partial [Phascolomyces articulosus]